MLKENDGAIVSSKFSLVNNLLPHMSKIQFCGLQGVAKLEIFHFSY